MYGYDLTYEELLDKSGLEKLSDRRERLFNNFADKMSTNLNYSANFPLNEGERVTRGTKIYKEFHARTDRLYNSPLYAMRRYLNRTPYHDRYNNPKYVDLSYLFNDPLRMSLS